ncbi:MAG: S-adenosylmethionine decarboxylase [Blastocatellia bacterium]|nr:S-adenosylmethionine decarboxylase [Blastocatellia bacterium]
MHSQHLLADLFEIEPEKLKDVDAFLTTLKESAKMVGFSILSEAAIFHSENSYSSTIFLKLNDSVARLSFHSYPDTGFLAFDLFCSADADTDKFYSLITDRLLPAIVRKTTITRGIQN